MSFNRDIENNTVNAENQVSKNSRIYEGGDGSVRVLFLGNSITLHESAPHIGWRADWGMAASERENDYVHLVIDGLSELYGDISYCITNVAEWERGYFDDENIKKFELSRDFGADIVVIRLGENVNREMLDKESLSEHLSRFARYFSQKASRVIITDLFWQHDAICKACYDVANELGATFVHLSDLGENDENKAIGLFWHEGVALHPGDLGMRRIADRILACF